jgi:4a-hydroxytetrahydrobiopterin dehydratase
MVASLADRSCVPCKGGTPPLNADQIAPLLSQLDGWQLEDDRRLRKAYRFKNWVEAVAFVDAITPVAEAEGHHPDLNLSWGKVEAVLWTHKIGGLSESDFVMAAKLDRVFSTR